MKKKETDKKFNSEWNKSEKSKIFPRVTIITPVYNRSDLLPRTLDSIKRQSCRDFEYIIVNDGSTEDLDGIVNSFMVEVDFPVLYLKKENGGVHSARNMGVFYARGEMIAFMDSDDEFTDDAIENLIKIWDAIPGDKGHYLGIKTKVMNQEGRMVGSAFPENINDLSFCEAREIYNEINKTGEHYGFRRADLMKKYPWPEPDGIKFVSEDIIWCLLEPKYRMYYSNYMPRIYHQEGEDSYIRSKKRTVQYVKNWHWNRSYKLNRPEVYLMRKSDRFKEIFLLTIFECILNKYNEKTLGEKLQIKSDRVMQKMLYFPSIICARIYISRRMK